MINLREWALPIYTILMEIAAGTLFLLWVARAFLAKKVGRHEFDQAIHNVLWIILLTISSSLLGSHFHLSKPQYSFLVLLNIGQSWLSREIAFSLLFLVLVYTLIWIQVNKPQYFHQKSILGWLAIICSSGNIHAMARIYLLPTQPIWNSSTTIFTFFLSSLILGSVVLTSLIILDLKYSEIKKLAILSTQKELARLIIHWLAFILVFGMVFLLHYQLDYYTYLSQNSDFTLQASVVLLDQFYSTLLFLRFFFAIVGTLFLIFSLIRCYKNKFPLTSLLIPIYISCLLILISEILNRFIFYALHIRVGI